MNATDTYLASRSPTGEAIALPVYRNSAGDLVVLTGPGTREVPFTGGKVYPTEAGAIRAARRNWRCS